MLRQCYLYATLDFTLDFSPRARVSARFEQFHIFGCVSSAELELQAVIDLETMWVAILIPEREGHLGLELLLFAKDKQVGRFRFQKVNSDIPIATNVWRRG